MQIRGLCKLPDGRDWLWAKLGFALVGEAMLSKSLIQFSAYGWSLLPFLQFGLTVVEVMVTSSKRIYASTLGLPGLLLSMSLSPEQATVNPQLHQRLLNTHRQAWLSLLWGHCSFLLGPRVHKVLFVPSKSLLPQSYGSSVIKSQWPSNSLGALSPFAGSTGWEICCGP